MSDSTLRTLGRSADPHDQDRRNAELIRQGCAEQIGVEWVETLFGGDKLPVLVVAAWETFQAHPCMTPKGSAPDPYAVALADVLDRIDCEDCWAEVSQAAAAAARVQAQLDWEGRVYEAYAQLNCDRAKTRQALGLRRMPSKATVKGEVIKLATWDERQTYRTWSKAQLEVHNFKALWRQLRSRPSTEK
jgi:hypothetical protein